MATTFPTVSQQQFAQRIAQLYPRGWANEGAKYAPSATNTGSTNTYFLFSALSSQIAFMLSEMQYALDAMRMQTETSPELDLASEDYLGSALPRPPGMSDATFYALIQANLFKKVATRSALIALITQVTGSAPRLIEPWCPGDTGCRDTLVSYRDVDTQANPCVHTSALLAYNGFIVSLAAGISGLFNQPLLTRDDGAYADANDYRVDPVVTAAYNLFDIVQAAKAFGTEVWIQVAASVNRN
jgi:hypothetical protein